MIKIRKPKIKVRKKYVNEALSQSTEDKRRLIVRKKHTLSSIADTVLHAKARRYQDLKKLYSRTMADSMSTKDPSGIPLSKVRTMVTCNVEDIVTGEQYVKKIIPATTILFCENIKLQAERRGNLGYILKYFNKPIIWTWDVPTAASDGIRIAFNPLFADLLLDAGYDGVKDMVMSRRQANLPALDRDTVSLYAARLFLFVLIHEAFHQIYRHREQALRKPETENGKNHGLANIAMDVEINRDIERLITPLSARLDFDFKGATQLAGGVFDNRFPLETWDLIFDAYYAGKVDPPQPPFSQQTTKSSYNLPNQQDLDNLNQQGQNQQGQNQQGQNQLGLNQLGQNQLGQNQQDQDQQGLNQLGQSLQGLNQQGLNQQGNSDDQLSLNQQGQQLQGGGAGQSGDYDLDSDLGDGTGNGQWDDSDLDGDFNDSGYGDVDKNNPLGTDLSDKSDDYKDAYGDEIEKQLKKMQGIQDDSDESSEAGESEEQQQARQQAREDLLNVLEDMEDNIESELNRDIDNDEASEIYKDVLVNVLTAKKLGGVDMMSKDEMADLAQEAGTPYDAKDMATSAERQARDYMEKYGDEIKKMSPDLSTKLTDIMNQLTTLLPIGANWRSKLKKHFRDAVEGDVFYTRSKRTMALKKRFDRYAPYKEMDDTLPEGANIFYLLDGSGSMWWAGGKEIFLRIFKEILEIEKRCKVLNSASAWFATGGDLPDDKISLWDNKTPVHKVIDNLGDAGMCSGTDISRNVLAVTKKKPPYYFLTDKKHTTIMVFTDGEECGSGGFSVLKQIPSKILKDVVFVIINQRSSMGTVLKQLLNEGGIKLRNIIAICREEFDK